jgi:hypothetical protein
MGDKGRDGGAYAGDVSPLSHSAEGYDDMKQYMEMTYADLELLPLWRVVTFSNGMEETFVDGITAHKADRIALRLSMQGEDCEACQMAQADQHVYVYEILAASKRLTKMIGEIK